MKNHEEKQTLAELIKLSQVLLSDIATVASKRIPEPESEPPGALFAASYQKWYSEARLIISRLQPDRLAEFGFLYGAGQKRKTVDRTNYAIRDWLLDVHSGGNRIAIARKRSFTSDVVRRFRLQCLILESLELCFTGSVFTIDPAVLELDNGTRDVPFEQDYIRFLTAASNVLLASKNLLFDGPEAEHFEEILTADLEKQEVLLNVEQIRYREILTDDNDRTPVVSFLLW